MKKNIGITAVMVVAALATGGCMSGSSGASGGTIATPSTTDTTATTSPPTSGSSEASAVTVSITGGTATVAGDGGRPVVLVAGALGVPPEVFRQAFSLVTPASAGNEPEPEQVNRNKAALLSVLAPYGVTNDELDAASNRYRYNGRAGESWPMTAATAVAVITNGKVTGVEMTNAGAGYTEAPTVTLSGPGSEGLRATATVRYSRDPATNGSVTAISLR